MSDKVAESWKIISDENRKLREENNNLRERINQLEEGIYRFLVKIKSLVKIKNG